MSTLSGEHFAHEFISPRVKLGTALLVAAIIVAGIAPLVLYFFN